MQVPESIMRKCVKTEEPGENNENANSEPSILHQSIKKECAETELDLDTLSDDQNLLIEPSGMVEFVEMPVVKNEEIDECDEEDPIKTNEDLSISDYCKTDLVTSEYCQKNTKDYKVPSTLVAVQDKKLKILTKEKVYQCDMCDNKFKSRSGLYLHLRRHSGVQVHTCTECHKQYLTPSALATHMQLHKGEKAYKCTQCDAAFHHARDLKRHMLKHTVVRSNVCTQCGQSYKHSFGLTTHMRIHTGERPYQCKQCSKAFTQSSDLYKHMRIHTGEKPYQCTVCSQAFTQSCNLKTHMKTHSNKT